MLGKLLLAQRSLCRAAVLCGGTAYRPLEPPHNASRLCCTVAPHGPCALSPPSTHPQGDLVREFGPTFTAELVAAFGVPTTRTLVAHFGPDLTGGRPRARAECAGGRRPCTLRVCHLAFAPAAQTSVDVGWGAIGGLIAPSHVSAPSASAPALYPAPLSPRRAGGRLWARPDRRHCQEHGAAADGWVSTARGLM